MEWLTTYLCQIRNIVSGIRRRLFKPWIIVLSGLACFAVILCISGPFQTATDTPKLSFPKDHGKHPGFQSEWWYVSGQLEDAGNEKWGYQLAIFRHIPAFRLFGQTYLRLPYEMYLGHLALTNISKNKFVFFEKLAPSVFGSGGALQDGLRVWIGKWKLEEDDSHIVLHARHEDFTVSLTMMPTKPVAMHSTGGLSNSSLSPDCTNNHYSMTSLETEGEIEWQGKRKKVQGKSWMDRDFFSGKRSKNLRGWDWFSLMLNNRCDIMIASIRSEDGTTLFNSYGSIIQPDGSCRKLSLEDFEVKPMEFWTSQKTNARYPVAWELHIPSAKLRLIVNPLVRHHELVASSIPNIDYWEGPVKATGWMGETVVSGKGYVELTGYNSSIAGKF